MQVNILEAKNRLSELVKSAQAGEEVIIANRGQPVVRLSPIEAGDTESAPVNSGAALSAWLQARPVRGLIGLGKVCKTRSFKTVG